MTTILKIGKLNIPVTRWQDAPELFDKVIVFSIIREQRLSHPAIEYIDIVSPDTPLLFRLVNKLFGYTKEYPNSKILIRAIALLIGILCNKNIRKINRIDPDIIYAGYNDFDDSHFCTYLIRKYINSRKSRYVRAFKETRPEINYLEKFSISLAQKIVFNHQLCFDFFKEKYGEELFSEKDILLGLDEDVRSERVINGIFSRPKLSEIDGKLHAVILTGRCFSEIVSANSNKIIKNRSSARQYYVDLIEQLIKSGIKVHLHTKEILPTSEGLNKYEELRQEYINDFFIESPLDFVNKPEYAYGILSQYNLGILHNYQEGSSVSRFDKINIPNRYFEYKISKVIPIIPTGFFPVLEDIFNTEKTGIVYSSLSELSSNIKVKEISHKSDSFKSYLRNIQNFANRIMK